MRLTNKLPSFSNVSAGSTCTLNMPVGLTYECVKIAYAGVTLAQLQNIEVRVDGKTVQYWSDATTLDQINQFYGRSTASGILTIWFIRPELSTLKMRRFTALGTMDVATLSLHIDIDAAAAAPVLSAVAEQSNPQPLGMITKVKSFPVTFATAGQQDIDTIPRSGALIGAIHLKKADISNVDMAVNSRNIVEATKTMLEEQQGDFGRTPVTAAFTHLDFLVDGDFGHALQTAGVQDMRIKPTLDTLGAVDVIVEYLDGIEGI